MSKSLNKINTTLKHLNYSQQHCNMWAKNIGHIKFCFCMETMTVYLMHGNSMDAGIKVRYNINADKLCTTIKEYEHKILSITK